MKKIILTLLMGAVLGLEMAGSIGEPHDTVVEAVVQPEAIHESVNDTPISPKIDTVELSTEKSTTESTGLSYISTELSTTEENSEVIPEAAEEVKSYNGITEGDIIVGEITSYCLCLKCCGKLDGVTASGFIIENGVQSYTAGCNWLPFGAVVEIDGQEYTIRDRGGKRMNTVGRVDIFTPEGHKAALENGRKKGVEVKVVSLPCTN